MYFLPRVVVVFLNIKTRQKFLRSVFGGTHLYSVEAKCEQTLKIKTDAVAIGDLIANPVVNSLPG